MLQAEIQKALAPLNLEQVAAGDYAKTGYHLEVKAAPDQMPAVAQALSPVGAIVVLWLMLYYMYRNKTFLRV